MLGGAVGARQWLAGLGFAFEFWSSPILLNFICGIFAWYVWQLARVRQRAVPAGLAGLAAFACLVAFALGLGPRLGGTFPWNGALGVVLLLALLRLDGAVRWPAWLLLIGDASYSLYLLHGKIYQIPALFVRQVLPPLTPANGILTILLTIGLAWIFHRYVERRFISRRRAAQAPALLAA